MKFTAVASVIMFSLLGIVAGVEVAAPAPLPAGLEARDVNPDTAVFEKRQGCAPSGCLCNKSPGAFCGNEAINPACTNGHAFRCAADGTTCDFGFQLGCTVCNQLFCPGLST
ncbi:hypothetical protein JOM56_010767 [Amanita muscaria]|uniref:Uncharacterized protein n=1 Tax=Amanita muscaria (strain Koide BX008) TaxID=946122 RepID=A0A0C2W4D3_AMAMK|nr:hypothetical protein M378DRAFT_173110 [Amanita muscaria Koide BX008]